MPDNIYAIYDVSTVGDFDILQKLRMRAQVISFIRCLPKGNLMNWIKYYYPKTDTRPL